MPDVPPYVEARGRMPVRAVIRGSRHDAVVLGWRGDRVYLPCAPTWATTSAGAGVDSGVPQSGVRRPARLTGVA